MNPAEYIAKKAEQENFSLYSVAFADSNGIEKAVVSPANSCNNSYSVAKTFIVTAIGMLWDAEKIRLDDRITDILERHLPNQIDPNYKKVTVEHLLTHTAGFDRGFLDIDAEDITKYPSRDFTALAFSEPIVHTPGTHFCYTDAAYYLLSVIVTELSGKRADDFLRPVLFEKLGFHEAAWGICPKGYTIGATGLFLRTEDMVKLGLVYANDGCFKKSVSTEKGTSSEEKILPDEKVLSDEKILSEKRTLSGVRSSSEKKLFAEEKLLSEERLLSEKKLLSEERLLSAEWVNLVLTRGYEFRRYENTDLYAKGGMCGQMLCFSRDRHFACAWHGYTRDTRPLLRYLEKCSFTD